jgi:hypothetical protein
MRRFYEHFAPCLLLNSHKRAILSQMAVLFEHAGGYGHRLAGAGPNVLL